MARFLLSFVLLSLTFNLQAEKTGYWVLGSFNSISNANAEKEHLEDLLGIDIRLMSIEELRVTRLVSEAKYLSQESLESYGIPAWIIRLEDGEIEENAVPEVDLIGDILLASVAGIESLPEANVEAESVKVELESSPIEPLNVDDAVDDPTAVEPVYASRITEVALESSVPESSDEADHLQETAELKPEYGSRITEVPLDSSATATDTGASAEDSYYSAEPLTIDSFELRSEETVAQYCQRMAVDDYHPDFCSERRLLAVKTKTSKLSRHGLELKSFCEQERLRGALREVCQRWQTAEEAEE